jgi:uncharacterized damage-inducible protein DinB
MTVAEIAAVESIANALLAEFEIQALITRRFLERIPEDRLTWKPHEKSMTAGQLGYHIAFVPGGVIRIVKNSPVQAPEFGNFPQPASREEILKTFDESVAAVRDLLPQFDDAAMHETWRLVAGGREVLAQPRCAFLRDVMLSHWYQHRGQLSVYLLVECSGARKLGTERRRAAALYAEGANSIGVAEVLHVPGMPCDRSIDCRKRNRVWRTDSPCCGHNPEEAIEDSIPRTDQHEGGSRWQRLRQK